MMTISKEKVLVVGVCVLALLLQQAQVPHAMPSPYPIGKLSSIKDSSK